MAKKVYTEEETRQILGSNFKMPVRDFAVTGIFGVQGAGKSDLIRELALGLDDSKVKILIIDPAGARGFEDFKAITFEEYKSNCEKYSSKHPKRWKSGILRMPMAIGDINEALIYIAEKFKNGILFLDEGNSLISRAGTISEWQSKMFRQCRNRCVDVYFAVHSFKDVKEAVRGHIKSMFLFRTPDQIDSPKFFSDLGYDGDHTELYNLSMQSRKRTYKSLTIQQLPKIWHSEQFKEQLLSVKKLTKG